MCKLIKETPKYQKQFEASVKALSGKSKAKLLIYSMALEKDEIKRLAYATAIIELLK